MKECISYVVSCILLLNASGQKVTCFNLVDLLKQHRFISGPANETSILDSSKANAITTKGIVWLQGIQFKEGTIDIDLRGKDVFLKSFLGVAFYGLDTTHCEILYFRPFNFKYPDTARRRWSVAYMSLPDYNYAVLRKAHPLMYENSVVPVPEPSDWFHASIVIKNRTLTVFVNQSSTASLSVTLIGNRKEGMLGLYSDGLTNDFANLTITEN